MADHYFPIFERNKIESAMRVIKSFLLVFLLSNICVSVIIAQESNKTKAKQVLFIGNSYTYFWNLPQTVMAMADSQGIPLVTKQSTAGGANLGQHWNYEKDLASPDLILQGEFDYVVLQDHSMRAIQHPDSLMHYGKLFGDLIKKKGAQGLLYMTWAREWDPYMQEAITEKYYELATQINARVVPVGLAWEQARKLRPGFELYDPDGSHPSPLGTYLTACVFYGILTGESPIGLPSRIVSEDLNGEKTYLNIQAKNDVLFCQKVADEILRQIPD